MDIFSRYVVAWLVAPESGELAKELIADAVRRHRVPLFDVISTAYERTSMIVTSNLPFESWTEVLGSERLTGATLDRLTHRCRIIETKGESYRLRDAKTRTRSREDAVAVASSTTSQAD